MSYKEIKKSDLNIGELVAETKISSREDGMLYFLGQDGHLWQQEERDENSSSLKMVEEVGVIRESGYLYYPDEELHIYRFPNPIQEESSYKGCMVIFLLLSSSFFTLLFLIIS